MTRQQTMDAPRLQGSATSRSDAASLAWVVVQDAMTDIGKALDVLDLATVELNRLRVGPAGAIALARDTVRRVADDLRHAERFVSKEMGPRLASER